MSDCKVFDGTLSTSKERLCSTAISYGDMCWRVLPLYGIIDGRCACGNPKCESPGKHPQSRFAPHGVKNATFDGNEICRWFGNGEVLNLGIATGPESGIVVVDVDERHGGAESLKALGDLPRTATVKTGGGWHYYFKCPEGVDIRNSAGKLGPGLDIRGAGGYVVAPPSMHVSGVRYKWLIDPRGGLAELPRAILDRLTERPKAAAPVEGTIPVGARDSTFASLAGSMRRRGMTEAAILAALRIENGRCEEPLPDADLQRIARSIGTRPTGTVSGNEKSAEKPTPELVLFDAATWFDSEPPPADQILGNMFDRGDKVAIIGASKCQKSFFLLQAALCLAAGRDFLGWSVPKRRKVVLIQMEIQAHHFWRRGLRMAEALEITRGDLEGWLYIGNGRGLSLAGAAGAEQIRNVVLDHTPDLICLDPLYKLTEGKENASEDMKTTLALFDRLAEETGAAVLYIHHDAKGNPGDRPIQDRGSGSGVLGRDEDARITITPHASGDDARVVETMLRNYRPQKPFTIGWYEGPGDSHCFTVRPDLAPTPKTSTTTRQNDATIFETCHPVALQLLQGGVLKMGDFKERLGTKTGVGQKRIDRYVKQALLTHNDPLDTFEVRGDKKHDKYVGTHEQIESLRSQT